MKKVTRTIAAAAVALSFNAGVFTTANATNNIRDFCRDAVEAGVFATMGECQSAINKGNVDACKEFWEVLGFKNQGQCVKWVREALNDFKKA